MSYQPDIGIVDTNLVDSHYCGDERRLRLTRMRRPSEISQTPTQSATELSSVRMVFAGLAASLVGIGLARFSYTPLIPVLIGIDWFDASDVFYLGAANLAGYLVGAISARVLIRHCSLPNLARAMMISVTLSFLTCAWPSPLLWFFLWRFVAGFAGGVLMVVAAPNILPLIRSERRGRASGIIFTGVGLGAAASGTLIPIVLESGLTAAWLSLALVSGTLTAATWFAWPRSQAFASPPQRSELPTADMRANLLRLYVQYGLNAAALVPHMIFLVDFVTRGAGFEYRLGAFAWVAFGIGAACGPFVLGACADRIGVARTLRVGFVVQFVFISLPLISHQYPAILISAFIAGAFTPGIVPIVLGRVREYLDGNPVAQQQAWSTATASFAAMQALGAFSLAWLFAYSGSYDILFGTGTLLIAIALLIDFSKRAGHRAEMKIGGGRNQ